MSGSTTITIEKSNGDLVIVSDGEPIPVIIKG